MKELETQQARKSKRKKRITIISLVIACVILFLGSLELLVIIVERDEAEEILHRRAKEERAVSESVLAQLAALDTNRTVESFSFSDIKDVDSSEIVYFREVGIPKAYLIKLVNSQRRDLSDYELPELDDISRKMSPEVFASTIDDLILESQENGDANSIIRLNLHYYLVCKILQSNKIRN